MRRTILLTVFSVILLGLSFTSFGSELFMVGSPAGTPSLEEIPVSGWASFKWEREECGLVQFYPKFLTKVKRAYWLFGDNSSWVYSRGRAAHNYGASRLGRRFEVTLIIQNLRGKWFRSTGRIHLLGDSCNADQDPGFEDQHSESEVSQLPEARTEFESEVSIFLRDIPMDRKTVIMVTGIIMVVILSNS